MSLDLGLVGTWQGESLRAMARTAAGAGERLQAELSTLLAVSPSRETWQGEAAAAAARRHDDLVAEVVRLAGVVTQVEEALTLAAGRVQSAGDQARAATRLAERHGWVLSESGLVLDPVVSMDGGGLPERHDVEVLARQALAEADQADADLTAGLAAVAARLVAGDADPPVGVLAAVSTTPLVGGADRMPAWALDQANRIRLARAEQDLTFEAERLRPPPGGGLFDVAGGLAGAATVGTVDGPSRRAAYLQVRDKLAAVQAIERVLGQEDGRTRQLLALDVTGRSAKAAVAVGDLDNAQHVAVVVPGFTTTVQGDLAGSDALAADLRDVARRESMAWGDRGEVAVVSWLGYDAPQVADSFGSHSVVRRSSAQAGAADLNPFLREIPSGVHLTLVGHSYGSTTAGLAVAAGGTGVADLVAIGSPGLGVASTGALGLPPSRVHVIEADGDPVADLGWFGRDPDHLAGVDLLGADAARLTDGSVGLPSHGHSQYLSPGTTSQWNIAAVVVGVGTVSATRPLERRVG